ncbi:MAG: toll/interleukin-1 receptor domain-containing protein [Rubrivivax sp.]|nr:toll/interleukin-1 receptor domain-containing protein [Rubrivivax sp.]
MKIFLSYPSASRPLAERLRLALEAEGHEVFFDRSDLRSGEYFHQALREAIQDCEVFVFLVTPASVARGSYCLTELAQAEQRWRRPGGHVLPVLLEPTPLADIPPYLQAVTLLQPRGEPVAETVAAVAALSGGAGRHRRAWLAGGAAAAALALALGLWQWQSARQAAEQRRQTLAEDTQMAAEATRYALLCEQGSHATAWAGLSTLPARPGAAEVLRLARQNCAMEWLRNARVTAGQQTFTQLVAPLKPVLAEGLAKAEHPERLATLRAHLGWAEFLERREGGTANPVNSYRQALQDDPRNPHALAMYGHNLLFTGQDLAAGQSLFDQALAAADAAVKARPDDASAQATRRHVQELALGQAIERETLQPWALRIANAVRQQPGTLPPDLARRFWSVYYSRWPRAEPRESALALPPAEALATFEWTQPAERVPDHERELWRYVQSRLLAQAGQTAQARSQLLQLQQRFKAAQQRGSLPDAVDAALKQLGPAPR